MYNGSPIVLPNRVACRAAVSDKPDANAPQTSSQSLALWSHPLRHGVVDMGALEGAALRQQLVHVSHGALGRQAASERAGRLLVAGVSSQSLIRPGFV